MKKRVLALLLCLVMALTLVPAAVVADGEQTINTVNLTYDMSKITLNTAYTEGEVDRQIRFGDVLGVNTAGISEIDYGNSGLMYKYSPQDWWGITDGESQVSKERAYGIEYDLKLSDGYQLPDTVMNCSSKTEVTQCAGFTVYVNGVERTDVDVEYNSYWNKLCVFVPFLETVSESPVVKSVAITDNALSVSVGETHQFAADVTACNGASTDITWNVTGQKSTNTHISNTGLLTVSTGETAEMLTVTATSKFDATKSGSVQVTVTPAPATIDSIEITEYVTETYVDSDALFSATLTGTQVDKSVTWSVSGNKSTGTTIDDSGKLTVSADETAMTLTVTATSCADPTKSASRTVSVKQKSIIYRIDLTCDLTNLDYDTEHTEGEVDRQIRFGDALGVSTTGIKKINISNSGLMYLPRANEWCGIGSGDNHISTEKQYGIEYYLEIVTGHRFPDSVKSHTSPTDVTECTDFEVYVNGVKRTDVDVEYNSDCDALSIYVPIDAPASNVLLGDVSGDGSINDADLTMLLRYVAKIEPSLTNSAAADMNNDGKIDAVDVTLLAKQLNS